MPRKIKAKRKKKAINFAQRKIILGLVIFFFCFIGSAIFFTLTQRQILTNTPVPAANDIQLLRTLKNKLVAIVQKQDPKMAMTALKGMLHDDRIANECHSLTHFIGDAAYDKYKDVTKALSYYDEMCGSGYLHGVIEEKFAQITSDQEIYQTLNTICAPQNLGICYHGIGHGFMWYSSDDLYGSLATCDRFGQQYEINNCYDGVFMENFEGDHVDHPTKYINAQNPSYPCTQVDYKYKESCYFYAARYYLILYPHSYTDAFAWCSTIENGFHLTCIKGVGSAMMKQNLNEPTKVAGYCNETTNATEKSYCIDGMVSYYLTDTYSLQEGKAMCQQLHDEDKKICVSSINIRQSMFPQ